MVEVKVVKKVLDVNDRMAEQNRKRFADKGIFVVNMMSSPGSGKTTVLEKTLVKLAPEIRAAVIVGDVCTSNDADRLAVSGAPVVQINTDEFGGACHLAAHVVEKAADDLDLDALDLLIVENVGNLVCPAEFDIGEDARAVVLSVTEGEDKPLKYPLMFRECDRLAVTGAPVVQVNTDEFGGDCHLAAHVIEKASENIDLDNIDLLIVENVGNLVCPAEFDW